MTDDLTRAKRIIGRLWRDRGQARGQFAVISEAIDRASDGVVRRLRADLAEARAKYDELVARWNATCDAAHAFVRERGIPAPPGETVFESLFRAYDAAKLEGVRLGLEAAADRCQSESLYDRYAIAANIRDLHADAEAIAKPALDPEAVVKGVGRG